MSYYLIFFNPRPVILANHSTNTKKTMHLACEGRARYNKAMNNYYRIMSGARNAFTGEVK
jgi:hypothetical protein